MLSLGIWIQSWKQIIELQSKIVQLLIHLGQSLEWLQLSNRTAIFPTVCEPFCTDDTHNTRVHTQHRITDVNRYMWNETQHMLETQRLTCAYPLGWTKMYCTSTWTMHYRDFSRRALDYICLLGLVGLFFHMSKTSRTRNVAEHFKKFPFLQQTVVKVFVNTNWQCSLTASHKRT